MHQLYEIWSGPTDDFGRGTGFTGLIDIDGPETDAGVQYPSAALR